MIASMSVRPSLTSAATACVQCTHLSRAAFRQRLSASVWASPRFPENVLAQSVRMPRLAPTFAHRRNQFQAVGHRAVGCHTFFLKEQVAAEKVSLAITLSLFAALITLRNIQTCSWLTRRAEALERAL